MRYTFILFITSFLLFTSISYAQNKTITGKITDAQTNESVPFASLQLKGTTTGGVTSFEGTYSISSTMLTDSLVITCIGYETQKIKINKALATQIIDVKLNQSNVQLTEVVIKPGENPSWIIMREVLKHKADNDPKKLKAYQYQAYTRSEMDIDNLSPAIKKNKITGKVARAVDNVSKVNSGDSGRMVLPLFVSEAVSDYFYNSQPVKFKEVIKKSKVQGVGFEGNSIINQFLGQGIQGFNFYNNYISLLSKDFTSPLAESWKAAYRYYLIDSIQLNNRETYLIEFKPRNKMDLAFTGKMWIDKQTFALAQIDATITKDANINFIDKIKVQQEFNYINNTAWMQTNGRLLIDVGQLKDYASGVLIKSYTSNSFIELNKELGKEFFDVPFQQLEDQEGDTAYWSSARPYQQTAEELAVIATIDSIKNIPALKKWINAMDLIVNTFIPIGKIELGPWPYIYANNQFEGHRFRIGFRSNEKFSKWWTLRSHVAISTKDPSPFKFNVDLVRILAKKKYADIGLRVTQEVEQIGLSPDDVLNFNSDFSYALFGAFSRFGQFKRPYYIGDIDLYSNYEPLNGLSLRADVRVKKITPEFSFAYYNADNNLQKDITTHEVTALIRYARGEYTSRTSHNNAVRLTFNNNYPIFTLRYTYASKALGADFEYHKVLGSISKSIRMGLLGRSNIELLGGIVPNTVPYPILFVHQGNKSPFMIDAAYNLMGYFEFISDKYVAVRYYHDFQGLFFNRVPLLKKLAWRTHAGGRMLYGGISQANKNIIAPYDQNNLAVAPIADFNNAIPYAECSYGVDNIFKFLSIDFVHRLSYLSHPDAKP
ncbi:MAG: DUF5686 family protein, partial [Bacteroidia bacterium]